MRPRSRRLAAVATMFGMVLVVAVLLWGDPKIRNYYEGVHP